MSESGNRLPFEVQTISRSERLDRERIADAFPGSFLGVPLPTLASSLGERRARLRFEAVSPKLTAIVRTVIPVALFATPGARSRRLVLGIETDLARCIVDKALGRDPGVRAQRIGDGLTSGEEGALLFTLDRAGHDWLNAGGRRFVIRSILADSEQVVDYLGEMPEWEVLGHLDADNCRGRVFLWCHGPVPPSASSVQQYIDACANWEVSVSIVVGASTVSTADVEQMCRGDLLVLDDCYHPGPDRPTASPVLQCGGLRRRGRWLDGQRIEIVSNHRQGAEMDTRENNSSELKARLTSVENSDIKEMKVTVSVEVGEVKLSVGQASALMPGRILRLDREVGPHVVLKVGEKIVGKGEIVEYQGEMAVAVKEVR
jgi:flagellar motor switch protein FliN/FliY